MKKRFISLLAAVLCMALLTSCSGGYQPGTRTEGSWESGYLGLCYTPAEGMQFADNDYIEQVVGEGAELLEENMGSSELKEYVEATSIYEFYAVADSGDTIALLAEKTPVTADEDAYLNSLTEVLSGTSSGYTFSAVGDKSVAGITFRSMTASVTYSGVSVTQIYAVKRYSDRMVCIISTSVSGEKGAEVLFTGFAAMEKAS